MDCCLEGFDKIKELGIPNEDCRFVLPNASITRIVTTMNCRALINFFGERCCTCAQWEIRNLANEILKICKNTLPEVFNTIGPKCFKLGYCPENKKRSCGIRPHKSKFFGEKDDKR